MKHMVYAILIVLAAAGCGDGAAPPPQPVYTPAPSDTPEDMLIMSGIDLYLHDMRPTAGLARKPTFWLHTEKFSVLDENIWAFEDARAIIYGEGGEDRQDIILEAKEGRFEEGKSALLKGGVKAHMGTLRIELADIEWQNPVADTPGEARSDNPVTVVDSHVQLEAAGVRIYPQRKEFILTGVAGTIRFGRNDS